MAFFEKCPILLPDSGFLTFLALDGKYEDLRNHIRLCICPYGNIFESVHPIFLKLDRMAWAGGKNVHSGFYK